jgi:hypothetical protein
MQCRQKETDLEIGFSCGVEAPPEVAWIARPGAAFFFPCAADGATELQNVAARGMPSGKDLACRARYV